jgi:hypothetical protein
LDYEELQKVAYGFLDLQPGQFWVLTLKEFNLMCEGNKMKEEREWQRTAQLAAWVVQPHVKKQITAEKLLKKPRTQEDAKEAKALFEKVKKQETG